MLAYDTESLPVEEEKVKDAAAAKLASFQIIPEQRYAVSRSFLQMIHSRGFEVAVHDLNHDGHLYKTREQFLERAKKINAYGQEFQAEGFRAAVLYMSSTDESIGQLGNGFSPRTVR